MDKKRDEIMNEKMKIVHDTKNSEFYCIVEGKKCLAHYTLMDSNTLDFDHTYVPHEFRDKGIAKQLFEAIIIYLEENKLSVLTSCSYAERFFSEEGYRKYLAER